MNRDLTDWWEKKKVLKVLRDFLENQIAYGKGVLRIFIPPGKLIKKLSDASDKPNDNVSLPKITIFSEALKLIFVKSVQPETGFVFTDEELMEDYSVIEISKTIKDEKTTFFEISFIENGETFLKQVFESKETGANTEKQSDGFLLNENLFVYTDEKEPLISEQIKQNQKLVNLAVTLMADNLLQNGFAERTYLNADLPTKQVPDPSAEGGFKHQLESMPRGAGTIQSIVGITLMDATGRETITNPQVIDKSPASADLFIRTADEGTKNILEESQQLHVLMAKDSTASGESRIQALTDFLSMAEEYKADADNAGNWILTTVTALALNIIGQTNKITQFQTSFGCRLFIGKLSAEDRRLLMEEVKNGVRSRRSAMVENGFADPDAEAEAVRLEAEQIVTDLTGEKPPEKPPEE